MYWWTFLGEMSRYLVARNVKPILKNKYRRLDNFPPVFPDFLRFPDMSRFSMALLCTYCFNNLQLKKNQTLQFRVGYSLLSVISQVSTMSRIFLSFFGVPSFIFFGYLHSNLNACRCVSVTSFPQPFGARQQLCRAKEKRRMNIRQVPNFLRSNVYF